MGHIFFLKIHVKENAKTKSIATVQKWKYLIRTYTIVCELSDVVLDTLNLILSMCVFCLCVCVAA